MIIIWNIWNNNYYNDLNNIIIRSDSKIITGNGTNKVALFTKDQVASILGVSSLNIYKCIITVNNGDGTATQIGFYNVQYLQNVYYILFSSNTPKGSIRINYCIIYNKG